MVDFGKCAAGVVGVRRKRTVASVSCRMSSAGRGFLEGSCFFPLAVDVVFCFAGGCSGPSLGDQVCFGGGGVRNALHSRLFLT